MTNIAMSLFSYCCMWTAAGSSKSGCWGWGKPSRHAQDE